MPPRTYSPVKLGTQPYNPVRVHGKNLKVGDILWLPLHAAQVGIVRAYKMNPHDYAHYGSARVEALNLGGPNGLLLSWV